jgi:hypothetical protein
MARPLRYEAAGAVYHVMARGDGGKSVFEYDKDRYGWVDLLEKAVIAALIRKRTGVSNRWIARRLGMGQESSVIRAVRRTKEYAREAERMLDLENRLPAD